MNPESGTRQVIFSIVILSNMIGFLASGFNSRYLIISLVSFFLIFITYEKIVAAWSERAARTPFAESYAHIRERIFAMSLPEAKNQALEVLNNPQRFSVTRASEPAPVSVLGPALMDFFSHYDSVRAVRGDFYVDRKFATTASVEGLIKIGIDIGGAEFTAKRNSDEIIERDSADDEKPISYPSIYHLILITNWVLSSHSR